MLTLNRFHTLFWCFHFLLWTNKYLRGLDLELCNNTFHPLVVIIPDSFEPLLDSRFKKWSDIRRWDLLSPILTKDLAPHCSKLNIVSYEVDKIWSGATDILPTGNYMFKVNNRNTRTRYDICSKLTINLPAPLASFWYLYCQLWSYCTPWSSVYIVKLEQVNADWDAFWK